MPPVYPGRINIRPGLEKGMKVSLSPFRDEALKARTIRIRRRVVLCLRD